MPPFAKRRSPIKERGLILAIFLLALLVRVLTLHTKTLWFDELTEFWVATASLSELNATIRKALQDPPLYSYLLHFWVKVGESEAWLRILSVLFSLLHVGGVYLTAKKVLGVRGGLLAAFAVSVAFSDIRYAQELAQYAPSFAFLSLFFYFTLKSREEDSWRSHLAASGFALLAFYTYYGTGIPIAVIYGETLISLLLKKHYKRASKVFTGGALVLILSLPLLIYWIPDQFFRGPTAGALKEISTTTVEEKIENFEHDMDSYFLYQFMTYAYKSWPWKDVGAWIIWLPTLAILSVSLVRSRDVISIWWSLAFVTYYLISLLKAYPFGGRHSLIISGLFWITLASGINYIWMKYRYGIVIAVFFLFWTATISWKVPKAPEWYEDTKSIVHIWLQLRQPGDTTYVYYGAVPGVGYQLRRQKIFPSGAPPLWFMDCWEGRDKTYCKADNTFYGQWFRELSPLEKKAAAFSQMKTFPQKFWLIFAHIYPGEDRAFLQACPEYQLTYALSKGNASLLRLEKKTTTSSPQ